METTLSASNARGARRSIKQRVDKAIRELFINAAQNGELPPIDMVREFALHEVATVCHDHIEELRELGPELAVILFRRAEPNYRCKNCIKVLGLMVSVDDENAKDIEDAE